MKDTYYLDLYKVMDLSKSEILIYAIISKFSFLQLPCTLSLRQYESLFKYTISKRQISRSINNMIKKEIIVNVTFRTKKIRPNSYYLWIKGKELIDRDLTASEECTLNQIISNIKI